MLCASQAAAQPTVGTYALVGDRSHRGTLSIGVAADGRAPFTLYLELGVPSADGCCVRTGTIESATARVSGNVALFESPPPGTASCSIVAVFSRSVADVVQFGDCPEFGAGVAAGGRYVRTPSRTVKK